MELTIERNELLAGLYLVQGVVERRTTIPILANVLLQSSGDGATLAATDNEVGIRRLCTATAKKKGAVTTGARRLYEMVREFPEGEIRIKSLENHWIEVSAGRSRFRLMGLDPREFPAIPEPSAAAREQTIRISAAVLSEMIEYTLFAVSADETRANLNGIYVECAEPGRLRMVATDGHRLAMVTRAVEKAELSRGIIIARKAIMELRKVIEGGAEEAVVLCVDGGVAHAERGSVQLSMRLVEGEFPDYQQVIPSKSEHIAEVPNARLAAALRRISIVSSERTRGVKLQFQDQKLEISSINPDVGEGVEEIELEYDGPPVGIGFNARYLIDALSVLPADNPIEIGLNDEVSPGVVRRGGDPDYCYIVMPMRL
jgi:DNA polymerase-3 subunit beta